MEKDLLLLACKALNRTSWFLRRMASKFSDASYKIDLKLLNKYGFGTKHTGWSDKEI